MRERRGLSNRKGFTRLIALPLLLGETTFSWRHPQTLLRRKVRFTGARLTATVRCSLWAEACRSASTAKRMQTASRLEIRLSLWSIGPDTFTCHMTMVLPGPVCAMVYVLQAGCTSVDLVMSPSSIRRTGTALRLGRYVWPGTLICPRAPASLPGNRGEREN